MPTFCLTKPVADEFIKKIKSGEINPLELDKLSNDERKTFFAKAIGVKEAKTINYLFEKNYLLKDKEYAYVKWARELLGITSKTKNDLIAHIKNMIGTEENGKFRLLNPETEKQFRKELVAMRLGTEATFKEAQKITQLSKEIDDLGRTIAGGRKQIELAEYVNSLVKSSTREKVLSTLGIPKTLMSSLDVSALLRQGWGSITTKEYWQNVSKVFIFFASEENYKNEMAKILIDPYYDLLKKGGFQITGLGRKLSSSEESFQTKLIQKFPIIGKLIMASERAYSGFLTVLRFYLAKSMVKTAEARGEIITEKLLKDFNKVAGSFTGRGDLGRLESVAVELNQGFFSPKKMKATMDMFNLYYYYKLSPIARYQALKQLGGSLATTSALLFLARLAGAKVETDPRSSEFGKFRIGKTRYDLTGGNGNYVVLLSRLATGKTITSKGKKVKLGEKYGSPTRGGIGLQYLRNKLSPLASTGIDLYTGKGFAGEEYKTIEDKLIRISDNLYPMVYSDLKDMPKSEKNQIPAIIIANLFGIGSSSY